MDHFGEKYAVVATIDPAAKTTSTTWTDAIDMDVFDEAVFILNVGAIHASGLVDFTVYSDAASATGGMTASVKAITQLGGSDDNKQVVVVVSADKLASVNGRDRYVRGKLVISATAGTAATAVVSVVGLGGHCRYNPASAYDLASVDEIAQAV